MTVVLACHLRKGLAWSTLILPVFEELSLEPSGPQLFPKNAPNAIVRAYIFSVQLLVDRACRSIRILAQPVNAEETFLEIIGISVLLVAPMALEVQPVNRRAVVKGCECLGACIVAVVVC